MTVGNQTQVSFASGELDSKVHGRYELKLYQSGLKYDNNFIVEPQGQIRFRPGTRFVNHTRLNQIANLIPFQYNDEQSYTLEFTNNYMRVHKDEGVVLEPNKTITGATQANPVVVTSASHGYTNGDEVYISSVVGMTELNGKYYLVANKTANTFELTDVDGNNIDGTGFTAYSSGGTSGKIFELATPYKESELFQFDYDQNADTMTITHKNHSPRNLTRTDHHVWTIAKFTRTNDPFPEKAITGITQANPGVLTSVAHGFVNGDIVTIQGVIGMTELNGVTCQVANKTADNFQLTDLNGNNIDTTGYTAYSSGGVFGDFSRTVGYYEGRRVYGGTYSLPETFWGSRSPSSSGDGLPRYADHTAGTTDSHAFIFTLSPTFEGTVNSIQWILGMANFLAIGTFGGINKATGSGANTIITPDDVNVKGMTDVGSAAIKPITRGNTILYVQRGRQKIRSLEYDALTETYLPIDRSFIAEHLTKPGIAQISFQDGIPDILWSVLSDGKLRGLTYKTSEDVTGWFRATIGGTDVKVLSACSISQPTSFDQVWFVVERTINGLTRRSIEFMEDDPVIPNRIDFLTGDRDTDENTFYNAMFEAQKQYVHVDSAITYDGSITGATITPDAVTGTAVNFTASASIFASTDVGREIWKKAIDGVGEGRAEITAYVSPTVVTCNIKKDFDNINVMADGDWYLTTDTLTDLEYFEGETVAIITDGAEHPQKTVTNGSVTLDFQASKAHVGFKYTGRAVTLNLEHGGITGSAQTKPKRVEKVNIRFLNTLRASFGTDFYNMTELVFRRTDSYTNRPQPLFTGIKGVVFPDGWTKEKEVIIEQTHSLPCIVQFLDIFMETSDE